MYSLVVWIYAVLNFRIQLQKRVFFNDKGFAVGSLKIQDLAPTEAHLK